MEREDFITMKKTIKRISALAITLMLFSGVSAQAAMSETSKAAPAIAREIAQMHEAVLSGEVISQVALKMGPGATFMGVKITDPMYHHHVMHYLCSLGAIPMHEDCDAMNGME